MPNLFKLAFYPFLVSVLAAYLLTPLVIRLAHKLGVIDDPSKSRHPKVIHTYPTPRGGGISLFLSVAISTILFLPLDKHLLGILIGATIIAIMGFLDDKYNLNPYLRLIGGFLAALAPIAAGIGIAFISNPVKGGIIDLSHPQIVFNVLGGSHSLWLISDTFALLWIVFLMNILNMGAKGIDGQLPGVVSISALTIVIMSLKFSADITQWPVIILALTVAGAYLGFLPWNFYPQKIMPGYGGSTLAGYLLAILSILSTTKVGTLFVVLSVPLIDTGYTIIRRIIHGKSPVWGDRGHLHHKLLDLGLSKRNVALIYWAATAILGILALNLNSASKLYTIIGITILLGGIIIWLTYRPKLTKKPKV